MTAINKLIHPEYVVLSIGISFIGAYCGIHLCEQFRLCNKDLQPKLLSLRILIFLMACSIGGVCIWSMHFIGMAAVSFTDPDGNPMSVRYRYDYTLGSLAVVVFMCYCGILICSTDEAFTLDNIDTVEAFVRRVKGLSIGEIQRLKVSVFYIMCQALTERVERVCLGGIVMAGGVCVMHYLGMSGVVMDAEIHWDTGIIAASVIIAIIAATAAYWILFRLLALYPNKEILRLLSAVTAAIAVDGMHYTGMAAASYTYRKRDYDKVSLSHTVDSSTAVLWAVIGSMVFSWMIILLIVADVRAWFYVTSHTVRRTDKLMRRYIASVEQASLIEEYKVIRLDNFRSRISGIGSSNAGGVLSRPELLNVPNFSQQSQGGGGGGSPRQNERDLSGGGRGGAGGSLDVGIPSPVRPASPVPRQHSAPPSPRAQTGVVKMSRAWVLLTKVTPIVSPSIGRAPHAPPMEPHLEPV